MSNTFPDYVFQSLLTKDDRKTFSNLYDLFFPPTSTFMEVWGQNVFENLTSCPNSYLAQSGCTDRQNLITLVLQIDFRTG